MGQEGKILGSMSLAIQKNEHMYILLRLEEITTESFPNHICPDILEVQSTSNNIFKTEEKNLYSETL